MTVTGKVQKFKMRETSVAELGLDSSQPDPDGLTATADPGGRRQRTLKGSQSLDLRWWWLPCSRSPADAVPADRQPRIDLCDSVDRMEPALRADNTEKMQPKHPTEPIDKIDPADPIERIEPLEPMDRIEPDEPMDKIEPDEPGERAEPRAVPMAAFSHAARRPLGQAGGRSRQRRLDTGDVIHAHGVDARLGQPDSLSRTRRPRQDLQTGSVRGPDDSLGGQAG